MGKVFIFDLDGTILMRKNKNWEEEQLILWLEHNGVKNAFDLIKDSRWPDKNQRLSLLGLGMDVYKEWYDNFASVEYQNNILKVKEKEIYLAENAVRLLKSIPFKKILVSNACKEWVNYAVDYFRIRDYFDFIFERDYRFGSPKKPDFEMANILFNNLFVPKDIIVIGDTSRDKEFAHNLGGKFIAVHNEVFGADFSFKSIGFLMDYLKNII